MATEQPWEVIRAAADELDAVLDGDLGNEWVHQAGTAIVEPLVAWLRDAAGAAEDHGVRLCSNEQKALSLARVILGESP